MTDTPSLRRSFRLVCNPGQIPSVEALLSAQGFVFEPEPFSPLARRLLQEPFPLGRSLAAFWGYVYIQDRSSMLPPLAPRARRRGPRTRYVRQPGSKTGLLAQLVGREGVGARQRTGPPAPREPAPQPRRAQPPPSRDLLMARRIPAPARRLVGRRPPRSALLRMGDHGQEPAGDQALAGRPPQTHAGSAAQAPDGSEPPAAPRRKARLFNLHNQCGRERGPSPFCR